ncbi:hypothetical protein [Saccharicrinis sp. FJH54]|uniref:hypothetical protein n=1 Tax=Saccharicrinis sp. FJH54 TaxID=3344665 RepID=UPI0035D50D10
MNEFTYHNIFETKGFEYIITIIFFALLIPFWLVLNKKIKVKEETAKVKAMVKNVLPVIPGGFFVNRNHTWAFLEQTGTAKIGIDHLITHMVGNVQIEYMKTQGEKIKKGELLAKLNVDDKHLKIYSPVTGDVVGNNEVLHEAFHSLTADPYGSGWLIKIEPENWKLETQSFYLGRKAMDWLKSETERLKEFMITSLKGAEVNEPWPVMQDGGELTEFTLSDMPPALWHSFQDEFLNKTS